MKKFICIMPTSVLESHVYEAVGNEKIGYQNSTTSFPIIPLIKGYEDGDQVCVCLHFGTPAMQFAIISGLQYAYRALRNVSIECVCTQGESGKYQNVDITALVQAGELLQTLTERRAKDPARILSMTLALGEDEE